MISIKICCIKSSSEASEAIEAGVQALGLVSEMPSGPGIISEKEIVDILNVVPSHVETFLLTSRVDPKEIAAQHERCKTNTLQLCSPLTQDQLAELRQLLPAVRLIPVIHVAGVESIKEAERVAQIGDSVLLDTGSSSATLVELGGTGRTHDWSVSAQIVDKLNVPVYLAGGLNSENVGQAIRKVKPYGVDVCSGVRERDTLSGFKLENFVARVRQSASPNS